MIQDDWTDQTIAERLQEQHLSMLEEIIARYSRELFYFIRLILGSIGNMQDVEECVSDVFVSVWQDHSAFDHSRGSFRTWLTMRAKYIALDRRRQLLRRQNSTVTLSFFDADVNTGEPSGESTDLIDRARVQEYWAADSLDLMLEKKEEQERLREALLRLPELDRQLIYMRYFMLASTEEMASHTGLSRHAIDTRIWRARKYLKETLREPQHGRV